MDAKLSLDELQKSENIAELLTEEQLAKVSQEVFHGYEIDLRSRESWEETIKGAMDIAKQTLTKKNEPFENASNVKFPLITNAAISFAATEFPELIKDDRVVQSHIVSTEGSEIIKARAERVSRFMSYQLLYQSNEWQEEMDRLLHVLPILGTVFKKVYYDEYKKRLRAELCLPDKIVVNYNITCLYEAPRITHVLTRYKNDIIEKIRRGLYLDIDVDTLKEDQDDANSPIELIEQHTLLDLDGDDYAEPYIVIAHKRDKKILRIINRFGDIEKNKKGEVICIEPEQFFIDYHFMRSPDGGFYSTGFGSMLYALNESINTLINQLIDSGTINNLQAGFLGKGIRIKNGDMKLNLGEWKQVDTKGEDLAKNIFPLPTKEPSATLFQLLGLLVNVGKDLSSITDLMNGNVAGGGQNVPATTMLALLERGMTRFNAIHKRLYQSLKKEFSRVYDINKKFITDSEYRNILNDPVVSVKYDFDIDSKDIVPVADPYMASDVQRLIKAQAIMAAPGLNARMQLKYYLEALKIDPQEIEQLLPPPADPNAPPPPETMKTIAETKKLEAEANFLTIDAQSKADRIQLDAAALHLQGAEAQVRAEEASMRISKMQNDAQVSQAKIHIQAGKAQNEAERKDFLAMHQGEKDKFSLGLKAAELGQKSQSLDNEASSIALDHMHKSHDSELKHVEKMHDMAIQINQMHHEQRQAEKENQAEDMKEGGDETNES